MTSKKKILVFTATYNERDNIVTLIYSILSNCPYADILIIDDNSPDKTSEKVQELQRKYKNIFLLNRKLKLGLDTAHKKAYDYAIKNNYDILITMDADLSHDPKEIKNFIYNLESIQVNRSHYAKPFQYFFANAFCIHMYYIKARGNRNSESIF